MNERTPRLEVYKTRSVLIRDDERQDEFREGEPSLEAKARLQTIRDALDSGFLVILIEVCREPSSENEDPVDEARASLLAKLVDRVTSEVGRALVGLTILQLSVKAIEPEQSIRLHKAGGRGSNFSWVEGIPMRVLDKNYITPVLRQFDLMKLNADGFMMTRSLAENYPYSDLYKAAIRGGRKEWLELVDLIESGELKPKSALKHLIGLLLNRTTQFRADARSALEAVEAALGRIDSLEDAIRFVANFVDEATYSARVFEVAMHALFQVLEDAKVFEGVLKPLCQMRSANKKHGNIADIEIIKKAGSLEILEAWDAKYGKPNLREELDEINEKLDDHSETTAVGFVVDTKPNSRPEIAERAREIADFHGVDISIQGFADWVKTQISRAPDVPGREIGRRWITALAESLAQQRRDRAPIDEPADAWITALGDYARAWGES